MLARLGRRASLVIAVRGAMSRNSTRTAGELDGHQLNFLRRAPPKNFIDNHICVLLTTSTADHHGEIEISLSLSTADQKTVILRRYVPKEFIAGVFI